MKRSNWILAAFGLWMIAFIVQIAVCYPQLPERVATHFNAQGNADGWSSKGAFLWVYALAVLLPTALFPGLYLLVPVMPTSLINLPHKDYWLSPAMRPYTDEVIREFLLVLGHLTTALMFVIMQMTLQANLHAQPRLAGWSWVAIGGYTLLMLLLTGWLWLKFRRSN